MFHFCSTRSRVRVFIFPLQREPHNTDPQGKVSKKGLARAHGRGWSFFFFFLIFNKFIFLTASLKALPRYTGVGGWKATVHHSHTDGPF